MFPLDLKYFGVISNSLAFHHGQSNIHSSENCNNSTLYSANVDLSIHLFIRNLQQQHKVFENCLIVHLPEIKYSFLGNLYHQQHIELILLNSNTVCFSPHKCKNYIPIKYICPYKFTCVLFAYMH